MKEEIKDIVGKTIKGVVVRESDKAPQSQVFLVFTDGTYYELYTSGSFTISGASGCYSGDMQDVLDYIPDKGERFVY